MTWIHEEFQGWTNESGRVEDFLGHEEMLDSVMPCCLPNSAPPRAQSYWEFLDDTLS